MAAGFIASLCCGGSIIFTSIGLGAFYGTLGLSRYIPQALAIGTLTIVAINWLYYRQRAARMLGRRSDLRPCPRAQDNGHQWYSRPAHNGGDLLAHAVAGSHRRELGAHAVTPGVRRSLAGGGSERECRIHGSQSRSRHGGSDVVAVAARKSAALTPGLAR